MEQPSPKVIRFEQKEVVVIQQSLHQKEVELLKFIRDLGHGQCRLIIRDGLPIRAEQIEKHKLF